MEKRKTIALVAHDLKKHSLMDWVEYNWQQLIKHKLICTGTTGRMVEETFRRVTQNHEIGWDISLLKSGPLGGDQQLGALICEQKIDAIIFFWDPMSPQPHDVDVKALLRICVLYNIVTASNRATADFVISSPLLNQSYEQIMPSFEDYTKREI